MSDTSTGPGKRPESHTTSTANATYVYTIGGDAGTYGGPHEAGDNVPSSVPSVKLKEWASAGVIKRAKPPRKDKK